MRPQNEQSRAVRYIEPGVAASKTNSTATQRFQVKHKTNIRMGTIDTVSDIGNTCASLLAIVRFRWTNTRVPVSATESGPGSVARGTTEQSELTKLVLRVETNDPRQTLANNTARSLIAHGTTVTISCSVCLCTNSTWLFGEMRPLQSNISPNYALCTCS